MVHDKRAIFWLVVVGILLMTAGCGKDKAPAPQAIFQPESLSSPSAADSIHVYFDATLSMRGFVTTGPATAYARVAQALPRAVVTAGWKQENVTYRRFGAAVESRDVEPLAVLGGAFYAEPKLNLVTRIDLVVSQWDEARLSVIVTDLFQDRSDVARITGALRAQGFGPGHALAIAGVRSAFDGEIYDLAPNGGGVRYRGPRPVYVLFLGRRADVVRLLGEFHRTVDLGDDAFKSLVLSPVPFEVPLAWTDASPLVKPPLRANRSWLTSDDSRVRAFDVVGTSADAIATSDLTAKPLPWAVIPERAGARITGIWIAPRSGLRFWQQGQSELMGTSPLQVTMQQVGGVFRLRATLSHHGTARSGLHIFDVRLLAPPDAFRRPPWVEEWTWSPQDVQAALSSGRVAGDRTLNLAEFVDDVLRVIVPRDGAEVGRLYVYFRRL